MEQFTIFYESLRGLWWVLSTNTLQCVLVIYTHFWIYNLKKNTVLNRKCSFIKFYLSLKWVFLFIIFGYLFGFSCLCFHSVFLIDGSKYSHWQILQKWKIIRTTKWTTQWTTQWTTYFLSPSLFLPFQTFLSYFFAAFIRVDNAIAKQRNVS